MKYRKHCNTSCNITTSSDSVIHTQAQLPIELSMKDVMMKELTRKMSSVEHIPYTNVWHNIINCL